MNKTTSRTGGRVRAPGSTGGRDETPPIRAGIGAGFFKQVFGGKPFIHCLIELVKNSRDWGASLIHITTNAESHIIRIVDNGKGMDEENRNAFASINMTTACGPRQSGRFCTGTKRMLLEHSVHVGVITAPEESPDHVLSFGFTADAYEALVLKGGEIVPEQKPKTSETWPYPFKFGTEITYTLRKPQSRGILRGSRLAEELSARLPRKFRDIVKVDGEMIPPKKMIGTPFDLVEQDPQLDTVVFEIYRPEVSHQEEDLRLAPVEIGEVPVSNLFRVLGELRNRFPDVYLLPEVCGIIAVPFFKDYANEDRFTLSSAIADDPRTPIFLRLLQRYAPEVERRLNIRIQRGSVSGEEDIEEIARMFNMRYNPGGEQPMTGSGIGEQGVSSEESGDERAADSAVKPTLQISQRKEYELNEPIELNIRIAKDSGHPYKPSHIQWHTERSRATNLTRTDDGILMTASELGHGVVTADIPGTPHRAIAHYEVVAVRIFRLSNQFVTIDLGDELIVMGVNLDKLKGKVVWSLEGVGIIEPQGGRVMYRATKPGHAVITAKDSSDAKTRTTCDVTVVPRRAKMVRIRDQYFEYTTYQAAGSKQYNRPSVMIRGDRTHRLIFNQEAHGYREALSRDILKAFLLQASAIEFARFSHLDLQDVNLGQLDPREIPGLLQDIANDGYTVFAELLEDTGKKASS